MNINKPAKMNYWTISRRRRVSAIVLHVVLALLSIIFLFPFLWMLMTALKTPQEIIMGMEQFFPKNPQWGNFYKAITTIPFFTYLGNSVLIVVLVMLGTLISSSTAAYAFAKLNWKGRDRWFVILLSTMMIPIHVILIPAGTIHCSGKNTMVLEISACVYILTFKLYDWGRLGLDGIPRPVHIEHGLKNLQYNRNLDYVKNELYNQFRQVTPVEEITGLHEREFLETRRATFGNTPVELETFESVNVANLVEGQGCVIESIDGSFEPVIIHYAETFVIPATISKFKVRSLFEHETCMFIKAHVR